MDNSVRTVTYKNSRDNMGKTLNALYVKKRRLPEGDPMISVINRKIELLKIIRLEMKSLINALD